MRGHNKYFIEKFKKSFKFTFMWSFTLLESMLLSHTFELLSFCRLVVLSVLTVSLIFRSYKLMF